MAVGESIQGFNDKALNDIKVALDLLPKEFSLARRRTVAKKGMDSFINAAVRNAPIDTGDLKLSIGTKVFRNNKNYVFGGVITKKKINIGGSVGSESIDAFYAKFLEYGWKHKKEGKPFLRPAWDETKERVKNDTMKLAEKRLKSYMKKVKIT